MKGDPLVFFSGAFAALAAQRLWAMHDAPKGAAFAVSYQAVYALICWWLEGRSGYSTATYETVFSLGFVVSGILLVYVFSCALAVALPARQSSIVTALAVFLITEFLLICFSWWWHSPQMKWVIDWLPAVIAIACFAFIAHVAGGQQREGTRLLNPESEVSYAYSQPCCRTGRGNLSPVRENHPRG